MAAAALCFAALAVCLLGGWNIAGLIPAMPYWCGAILALSFAALTVLLVVGCVYYGRFCGSSSAPSAASSITRWLPLRARRRCPPLRSARSFPQRPGAACFVLSYVVCALSAGSLQFWHAWGWFRN